MIRCLLLVLVLWLPAYAANSPQALLEQAREAAGDYEADPNAALALFEQALTAEAARPDPVLRYQILGELADHLYFPIDDDRAAVRRYREALQVCRQARGGDHPDLADLHRRLGQAHCSLNQDDLAVKQYEQSLAIYERRFGPDAGPTADAVETLASHYRTHDEPEKALGLYERLVGLREKLYGPDNPALADTLADLADVHFNLSNPEAAEPHLQRAAALAEAGEDEFLLARVLAKLGSTYSSQQKHTQAREAFERALEVSERSYGRESGQTEDIRTSLLGLQLVSGDFPAAGRTLMSSMNPQDRHDFIVGVVVLGLTFLLLLVAGMVLLFAVVMAARRRRASPIGTARRLD
jgi:tetratricopeptide (TPR) repeat protein